MNRYIILIHGSIGGQFELEVAADTDSEALRKAREKARGLYPFRFDTSILVKEEPVYAEFTGSGEHLWKVKR